MKSIRGESTESLKRNGVKRLVRGAVSCIDGRLPATFLRIRINCCCFLALLNAHKKRLESQKCHLKDMLAWPTKPAADAESAHRHHQNYRLKKELAYTQHSAIGFYREPEKYHFEDLTGSETDMQLENVVQLSLPLCR